MSRKIVRSRDVVFTKDQLINDGDKVEKASSSTEIPIRIDPIVPPTVHANHMEELQEEDGVIKMKITLKLMMLSQLNKLMENIYYHHMNHH